VVNLAGEGTGPEYCLYISDKTTVQFLEGDLDEGDLDEGDLDEGDLDVFIHL